MNDDPRFLTHDPFPYMPDGWEPPARVERARSSMRHVSTLLTEARTLPPLPAEVPERGIGDPSCSTCRGFGWVRTQDAEGVAACRCVVLDPAAGLPPRFRDATFTTFEITRNLAMEPALNATLAVATGTSSFAFLFGPPGLGKTHLLAAAVRARRERRCTAIFAEVTELLAELRAAIRDDDMVDPVGQRIGHYADADTLLALDDLGAHNPSNFSEESLYRILNRRYNSSAPTIISSNAPLELIDPRIRSRFRAGFVLCKGRDLRGEV